jgi:very-short-patch-repair endonuclease
MRGASEEVQAAARQLRREMTPAERQLWNGLRGWRLGRFRRQHAIGPFILDFYCPAARLCIEVDGSVHDGAEQRVRDAARTDALATLGIRVVRFRNKEVLTDTRAVLRRIKAELSASAPAPSGFPLPLAGEGGGSQAAG